MSKKSLKRKMRQRPEISARDALEEKKRTMREASDAFLGSAVMFFLMAAATLILGLAPEDASQSKNGILLAASMILILASIFAVFFIRRIIILQKLSKITTTSEDTVKIICKKMTFIEQPISKNVFKVICVILTDENGKKYYDVVNIFYLDKKEIRARFINEAVTLSCYKSTCFVKSLSKAYKEGSLDFYIPRY